MEQKIAVLEKTVKQLEAELSDDKIYKQQNRLQEVNKNLKQKQQELKQQQDQWEALASQILEMEEK